MKKRHLALTALVFATACTTVNYTSPDVATVRAHRTVAVLPVEMVFTGKAPAGLTGEEILGIEEGESLAFQTSLYFRLLNRVGKGRLDVELQQVEETNRRLATAGIGIRESWVMPPVELADILGVDAIARTRVKKTRYMSDLASFSIEVGSHVLHELVHDATDGDVHLPVLYGLVKTHDIYADGSLLSGRDGTLLWQVAVHRSTDWSRPANDVVEGVTKKLARKFPYRT